MSVQFLYFETASFFDWLLDYQDSNLDKQNQNLLCYHYTIVQTSWCFPQKTLQR